MLEGVLASMALPPWFAPVETNGRVILDGATVSNLPIEAALTMGATEIIALSLDDPRSTLGSDELLDEYVTRLFFALSSRHSSLETKLAEARGVTVRRIELQSHKARPIWDFSCYQELILTGYKIASREIGA